MEGHSILVGGTTGRGILIVYKITFELTSLEFLVKELDIELITVSKYTCSKATVSCSFLRYPIQTMIKKLIKACT